MKNKLIASILLCAAALFVLSACTVGVIRSESREVSDFSSIAIDSFGEFHIRQGEEESLTIEGPNNYLRNITTEVIDGVLHIRSDRGFIGNTLQRVEYNLTVKDLNSISLSGAGSIDMPSLDTDALDISLTGAGSIRINSLNAESLSAVLNSAGSINVAGNVTTQNIVLNGVGSYDGDDLRSSEATVVVSGAGSADIWAVDILTVTISGVGSVNYYGYPTLSQSITGLGSVNGRGER